MTKAILKDKLIAPFIYTLTWILFHVIFYEESMTDQLTSAMVFLFVVAMFSFIMTDRYIQSFYVTDDNLEIRFQKNFEKSNDNSIIKFTHGIESVVKSKKSLLSPFHTLTIKFIGENGKLNEKTFKTNSDGLFNRLILELNTRRNRIKPFLEN